MLSWARSDPSWRDQFMWNNIGSWFEDKTDSDG
jgi:hypothetical protein